MKENGVWQSCILVTRVKDGKMFTAKKCFEESTFASAEEEVEQLRTLRHPNIESFIECFLPQGGTDHEDKQVCYEESESSK